MTVSGNEKPNAWSLIVPSKKDTTFANTHSKVKGTSFNLNFDSTDGPRPEIMYLFSKTSTIPTSLLKIIKGERENERH